MYENIRRNPPTYPAKPWGPSNSKRRPELKSLPLPSYGGGRPPNMAGRERVYRAILDYAGEHGGNTPTRRELLELCDMSSTSVVSYHIAHLVEDGLLELRDRKLIVCGGTWAPPEGTVNK